MKKTNEFKAESRQLLDLMIHSIYSNKEIFLRELISNASDALDKRRFLALQNDEYKHDELKIEVLTSIEDRTVTIIDNGVGMNESDLENNLGTIAHSGSKEFLEKMVDEKKADPSDIIGQFGVGFYSSFIVADSVEVFTKAPGNDALKWTSDGQSEYTIEKAPEMEVGTKIVLHIRDDEEYEEFINNGIIQGLIKKHSDYIKYPIYMYVTSSVAKKDDEGNVVEGEYVDVTSYEVVNSQIALWRRPKSEITQEDYDNFYMQEFGDYQPPLHTIHTNVEGLMSYHGLIFIPRSKSYDFYQPTYKKGLALYSKGVLIEENTEALVTDAFKFVKGLVDSSDISLNISREMLQQDKQVERLGQTLEGKIKSDLAKMQKRDRDTYNEFYDEYGMQLMYGVYDNFGAKKDLLKDLIMFKTSKSDEYVTLKEYIERMKEDQEHIYFIVGDSKEQIEKRPQMEQLLENDIEVLYFIDDVDEFAIRVLDQYDGKTFQSITQGDFDFATEEEKEKLEEQQTESKGLLAEMKDALVGKVDEVRLTTRLKNSAASLVGGDGLSLEMEKILSQGPDEMAGVKAQKILEINPKHPLFAALEKVADDESKIKLYSDLVYQQALLIEGLPIEDPVEYANKMSQLMVDAIK